MTRRRKPSYSTLQVLSIFLEDPAKPQYGLAIAERTGSPTGTIYPILRRLEDLGWLESSVENIDARVAGRSPRRLYGLTGLGETAARRQLTTARRGLGLGPVVTAFIGSVSLVPGAV
jgi:PadR family transcriptional regulator PadR